MPCPWTRHFRQVILSLTVSESHLPSGNNCTPIVWVLRIICTFQDPINPWQYRISVTTYKAYLMLLSFTLLELLVFVLQRCFNGRWSTFVLREDGESKISHCGRVVGSLRPETQMRARAPLRAKLGMFRDVGTVWMSHREPGDSSVCFFTLFTVP